MMTGRFDKNFLDRFHSKYSIQDGCWIWNAGKDKDGYGNIKFNRKTLRAHRVMYEINNGEISQGLIIMYSCDNPSCVNPKHLFIGSHKDNTQDMIQKKRKHLTIGSKAQQGILNGKVKLTEDDIKEIRTRYYNGEKQINLAPEYGITQGAIHKIIARRTWKHVK